MFESSTTEDPFIDVNIIFSRFNIATYTLHSPAVHLPATCSYGNGLLTIRVAIALKRYKQKTIYLYRYLSKALEI
jgi:hypothetical protein